MSLGIYLGIKESMIGLNEDDILMAHVWSRYLDEETKATQWIWLW